MIKKVLIIQQVLISTILYDEKKIKTARVDARR